MTKEIEGLFIVGGEYSSGFHIDAGNYHVKVKDASNGETKSGDRGRLNIELMYFNDPNHAAKEGKTLIKTGQNYASPNDDADKKKMMNGFLKRLIFDGFGLEWPKAGKAFDPRLLVGREAWVQIRPQGADAGEFAGSPQLYAVAQNVEDLPKLPAIQASATAIDAKKNAKNGQTAGTGRRR